MPRSKVGITTHTVIPIWQYFERAIKDNRLWDLNSKNENQIQQAIEDFHKQFPKPPVEVNSAQEMERICYALQAWIDKYIPTVKWQRCLKTLRQRKSRKRLGLHHLDLNHKVYSCVKELSEIYNLNLSEVIYKLAKAELNRLEENTKKENATI